MFKIMQRATQPLRILLPGGSGHLGQLLARHFQAQGHAVTILLRHPANLPWRVIGWDGRTLADWVKEIDRTDVVINLAGRSVNCRYTHRNRREILESRIFSTEAIGHAIARSSSPPAIWMNMSTATIYRHALDHPMDETTGELGGHEPDAPSAWRFSIDVATQWEQALFSAVTPRTRKIALRSAMVMSAAPGGVFNTLLNLVRAGLGGAAGPGTQFVSWIHEADFTRAIDFLIAHQHLDGCVNLSSPTPLPNREFMRILRQAWGIRSGLRATGWMLAIGAFFLRTETELILKSRRVIPGRLLDAGFQFLLSDWNAAARDLTAQFRALGPHKRCYSAPSCN